MSKVKQSSKQRLTTTISLVDVIASIRSHGIYSNERIAEAIIQHFNNDNYFKERLYGILASRLKVSTANLYKSIKFDVVESYEQVKNKKGYSDEIPSIMLYLTINRDKLPALLSKEELNENKSSIPSINELVDWINGKRSYFKDAIDEQNDRIRARALKMQRDILVDYKNSRGRPNTGYGSIDKEIGVDGIVELAKTIRKRMELRIAGGKPATKGSEFIFLGNYNSEKYKGKFSPKYKKESSPLLSINGNDGEINKAMIDYASHIIQKELNELIKTFKNGIPIDTQLVEIGKNVDFRMASEIDHAFDLFLEKISKFRPGESKIRKEYELEMKSIAAKATKSFHENIVIANNNQNKTISVAIKKLIDFKAFYTRGRRAKMRPGRNYKTIGEWLKG